MGAFWKRFTNGRNFKTVALRLLVDEKHFKNGDLGQRWRHDNHVIFMTEISSNKNSKWPLIVAFLQHSVGVNIWYVFGVKTFFENYSGVYWGRRLSSCKPSKLTPFIYNITPDGSRLRFTNVVPNHKRCVVTPFMNHKKQEQNFLWLYLAAYSMYFTIFLGSSKFLRIKNAFDEDFKDVGKPNINNTKFNVLLVLF